MSDPSGELQKAIYDTLRATSPQIAGGRILDSIPANTPFPYVSFGPCQILPDKADCIDGVEVYPQIDVWSRAVGFSEVKSITKQVLAALDEVELSVEGFNTVVFQINSVNYLRDPDGLTSHAALVFFGILTPA